MGRLSLFSLIGGGVFFAGLFFQVGLVRYFGMNADWSYAAQAIFSIELSYILNRYLTWRDKETGFWIACWKFNVQKLLMTVVNMSAYALLVHVGMQYIVANVLLSAIFTPINYIASHALVFAQSYKGKQRKEGHANMISDAPALHPRASVRMPEVLPSVSVVIPCKSNEKTIYATVAALLAQDYPVLKEVILVGDVGDSTWRALTDIHDERLIILEHEKTPGKRDPNVKRDKGIRWSSGEVIALADSDIVADRNWLSQAVGLLDSQAGGLVAGGMRSIHDTFWGRFVDNNRLAAKTPRLPRPYHVTAENFGKRGFKPPVTANAVFGRELYDECPLDVAWAFGYEDYEWMWRVAKTGHPVLFTGELTAAHHHRRSFRKLVQEYRVSAEGCARFIRRHRDSPLARRRRDQAVWMPLAALTAIIVAVGALAMGEWKEIVGLMLVATIGMSFREVVTSRRPEAAAYPFAAGLLGLVFTQTLVASLLNPPPDAVDGDYRAVRKTQGYRLFAAVGHRALLAVILAVQAGASLSLIWSNTAFADEANYLWQGRMEWAHWLHGTPIPQFQDSGAHQIYPPLGALANSIGGLAGARALSMIFMLTATVLLYLTASRLFGRGAALMAAALWAVSEPVLRLAFATYDPMACLLIALSAWLVVQAGVRRYRGEIVALATGALGLASVVCFSFGIMVPVVTVFAFLYWRSSMGARLAWWCTGWLFSGAVGVTVALMTGLHLWQDAIGSTVSRPQNVLGQGATAMLRSAWGWDGLLCALAGAGIVIVFVRERSWNRRLLVLVIALAGLLVPAYQTQIGTGWALDKHMSAGTWFMAIAAGYGVTQFSPRSRKPLATVCVLGAFLIYPTVIGIWYARSAYQMWPNEAALVKVLTPLAAHSKGEILASNDFVLQYYLPEGRHWQRWDNSTGNPPASLAAGKVGLVVLNLNGDLQSNSLPAALVPVPSNSLSSEVLRLATPNTGVAATVQEVESSKSYRLVAVIPYVTSDPQQSNGVYVVWQRVYQRASHPSRIHERKHEARTAK